MVQITIRSQVVQTSPLFISVQKTSIAISSSSWPEFSSMIHYLSFNKSLSLSGWPSVWLSPNPVWTLLYLSCNVLLVVTVQNQRSSIRDKSSLFIVPFPRGLLLFKETRCRYHVIESRSVIWSFQCCFVICGCPAPKVRSNPIEYIIPPERSQMIYRSKAGRSVKTFTSFLGCCSFPLPLTHKSYLFLPLVPTSHSY